MAAAVIFLFFFILSFDVSGANSRKKVINSFAKPDFAFPSDVEANAQTALDKAMAGGDYATALTALLQLDIASGLRTADVTDQNCRRVDSVSRLMPEPWRGVGLLLEASLYYGAYAADSWSYDKRVVPVGDAPADCKEWSRDIFIDRISGLLGEAAGGMAAAGGESIAVLGTAVENSTGFARLGFTVGDFVSQKTCSLLDGLLSESVVSVEGDGGVIPFFRNLKDDSAQSGSGPEWDARQLRRRVLDGWFATVDAKSLTMPMVAALSAYGTTMSREDARVFYKEWYDRTKESPLSLWILGMYAEASEVGIGSADASEVYGMCAGALRQHPKSTGANEIRNIMNRLGRPDLNISLPGQALPGQEIKAVASLTNTAEGAFWLVRLPAAGSASATRSEVASGRVVRQVKVSAPEGMSVPFVHNDTLSLGALEPGRYTMVPATGSTLARSLGTRNDGPDFQTMSVSSLTVMMRTASDLTPGGGALYVVRGGNMQPVEGAEVVFFRHDYRRNPALTAVSEAVTDSAGCVGLPEGTFDFARISKGEDYWEGNIWGATSRGVLDPVFRAAICPDRAIARPGERVGVAAVVYSTDWRTMHVAPGRRVRLELTDASRNVVDTLIMTTDDMGRVHGEFTLPSDRMLGMWYIRAVDPDNRDTYLSGVPLRVEEYKLPGFAVTLEVVDGGTEGVSHTGGVVTLRGKAMTFSGMPVTGARAEVTVRTEMPWIWRMPSFTQGSCSHEFETDSNGEFLIPLDAALLEGTPYRHSLFRVTAAVTDRAGETREAPGVTVSFGQDYAVRPDIPSDIEVTSDTVTLKVPVYAVNGTPAIRKVRGVIRPEPSLWPAGVSLPASLECEFDSPVWNLDSNCLPSGTYSYSFTVAGNTGSADVPPATGQFTVWRSDDTLTPRRTPLWVPVTSVVAPSGAETVEVRLGSGYADSWLLCQISDLEGGMETHWIHTGDGTVNLPVCVPGTGNVRFVTLAGMRDLEYGNATVRVVYAESAENLSSETESFRSAVMAGNRENWRWRYTFGGEPRKVGAMAVMTDAALNALTPFGWSLPGNPLSVRGPLAGLRWNNVTSGRFYTYPYPAVKWLRESSMETPEFMTWGYPLGGVGHYMVKEALCMDAAMPMASANGVMMKRSASVTVRGTAAVYSSMQESAEEEGFAGDADSGGGSSATAESPMQLRPSELPVAFFMPGLVSDGDGTVEVSFEVPDFNTTWQFQLAAYDTDMHTLVTTLETVASKPVMVRLNTPRFMRTGDRVTVMATLFNNTAAEARVGGRLELVGSDGRVLVSRDFKGARVAPSGSRVVSMIFDVPDGMMQVALRGYAIGGDHRDGEEAWVDVLPSSTPVIESMPFWIAPGTGGYSVKLPKFNKGSRVTLQYCDNPVWYSLTALPAIIRPEGNSILELQEAIYANCIGVNLLSRDERLRRGLEMMLAGLSRGERTLVSPLSQDSDLKAVPLPATPWVNDAAAETDRMSRLGSLTDTVSARSLIGELAGRLVSRQNADGSWSWCEGMKGSRWITGRVVLWNGMLNSMGYLPGDGMHEALRRAVAYIDREFVKDWERARKAGSDNAVPVQAMNDWLYVRSMSGVADPMGSEVKGFDTLARQALEGVVRDWRKMDIYSRATAAMTLDACGRGSEAVTVLESLAQSMSVDPAKGMWFDTLSDDWSGYGSLITTAQALEAYERIMPDAPQVDGLRQWLLTRRQVENWGDNPYTAEVVHAILTGGTVWTGGTGVLSVCLGGREIALPETASVTGSFTLDLDAASASGRDLVISRDGSGPAWGGTVSQYVMPVSDVREASIPPLSVRREVVRIDDKEGRMTAGEDSRLEVGDLVRVTVTVTSDRDMDYVTLADERCGAMEPVDALSGYAAVDGVYCYREVRDTRTTMFFDRLPKGTHLFSYDCRVNSAGTYASGMATVQSLYSPLMTAHSAGSELVISEKKGSTDE